MRNRSRKLDVTHSFPSYFGFGNFYAATVADDTFISDSLILTAMAFPVLHRPENLFAEKTVFFRF